MTATTPATLGPYRALNHRFALRVQHAGLAALLSDALESLASPTGFDHEYRLDRDADRARTTLSLDGFPLAHDLVDDRVVDDLLSRINHAATDSWPLPVIHGAAVADRGRAVLLVGPSGAGKSSLTTALVRGGLDYLTEELIALDEDSTRIVAYPRPISLERAAWPEVPTPMHGRDRDERFVGETYFVNPSHIRASGAADGAVIDHVVLLGDPSFHGTPLHVAAPRSAEAVTLLAGQTFKLATLGRAGLERLRYVVMHAEVHTLRGGSIDERARFVRELRPRRTFDPLIGREH